MWCLLGRVAGYQNSANQSKQDQLELIDQSTTFFELLRVSEKCSMYKFGTKRFPNFQPQEGFGYYKVADKEMEGIQYHKRDNYCDGWRGMTKYRLH